MATRPESDEQAATDSAAPSALNTLLHYLQLGAGPVLGLLALVVAVIAISGTRSLQDRIGDDAEKIKKLSADLTASQIELKKMRNAMQQDNASEEEELKKQQELDAKLVQNLSRVQAKLKIAPTLEEQLQPAASASAVPAASAVSATTVPAGSKPQSPQVKSMIEAIKQFNAQ